MSNNSGLTVHTGHESSMMIMHMHHTVSLQLLLTRPECNVECAFHRVMEGLRVVEFLNRCHGNVWAKCYKLVGYKSSMGEKPGILFICVVQAELCIYSFINQKKLSAPFGTPQPKPWFLFPFWLSLKLLFTDMHHSRKSSCKMWRVLFLE